MSGGHLPLLRCGKCAHNYGTSEPLKCSSCKERHNRWHFPQLATLEAENRALKSRLSQFEGNNASGAQVLVSKESRIRELEAEIASLRRDANSNRIQAQAAREEADALRSAKVGTNTVIRSREALDAAIAEADRLQSDADAQRAAAVAAHKKANDEAARARDLESKFALLQLDLDRTRELAERHEASCGVLAAMLAERCPELGGDGSPMSPPAWPQTPAAPRNEHLENRAAAAEGIVASLRTQLARVEGDLARAETAAATAEAARAREAATHTLAIGELLGRIDDLNSRLLTAGQTSVTVTPPCPPIPLADHSMPRHCYPSPSWTSCPARPSSPSATSPPLLFSLSPLLLLFRPHPPTSVRRRRRARSPIVRTDTSWSPTVRPRARRGRVTSSGTFATLDLPSCAVGRRRRGSRSVRSRS